MRYAADERDDALVEGEEYHEAPIDDLGMCDALEDADSAELMKYFGGAAAGIGLVLKASHHLWTRTSRRVGAIKLEIKLLCEKRLSQMILLEMLLYLTCAESFLAPLEVSATRGVSFALGARRSVVVRWKRPSVFYGCSPRSLMPLAHD